MKSLSPHPFVTNGNGGNILDDPEIMLFMPD